jgi:hypothetical protein
MASDPITSFIVENAQFLVSACSCATMQHKALQFEALEVGSMQIVDRCATSAHILMEPVMAFS